MGEYRIYKEIKEKCNGDLEETEEMITSLFEELEHDKLAKEFIESGIVECMEKHDVWAITKWENEDGSFYELRDIEDNQIDIIKVWQKRD